MEVAAGAAEDRWAEGAVPGPSQRHRHPLALAEEAQKYTQTLLVF